MKNDSRYEQSKQTASTVLFRMMLKSRYDETREDEN